MEGPAALRPGLEPISEGFFQVRFNKSEETAVTPTFAIRVSVLFRKGLVVNHFLFFQGIRLPKRTALGKTWIIDQAPTLLVRCRMQVGSYLMSSQRLRTLMCRVPYTPV